LLARLKQSLSKLLNQSHHAYTRNEFLKLMGLTGATALTGFTKKPDLVRRSPENVNLSLGLASYTLRKFKLDDVIKMTKRVGLGSIALKDVHMPLEVQQMTLRP